MNPRKPSFPQPDGPALLKPWHVRQEQITQAVHQVIRNCIGCNLAPDFIFRETEEWARIHQPRIRAAFEELTKE
jgi:hypothetical protein